MSVQFDSTAALPPGKEPRYPLDRRLREPQRRSGRDEGTEKNSFPVPTRNRIPIVQSVA